MYNPHGFVNGLDVEKRTIPWKIERFNALRNFEALIPTQKFEFSAGATIGLPTKWQFNLDLKELGEGNAKNMWIGVFCGLLSKPKDARNVCVEWLFRITSSNDDNINRRFKTSFHDFGMNSLRQFGYHNVIPLSTEVEDLPLTDEGALTFQIDFKLYANKVPNLIQDLKDNWCDSVNVNGGDLMERKSLIWKIDNFEAIRDSDEMISEQKLEFEAGSSIGLLTNWSVYLEPSEVNDRKWISVFMKLTQKPENVENVNAKFVVELIGAPIEFDSGTKNFVNLLTGCANFVDREAHISSLPLTNGALSISVEFMLYAPFQIPSTGQLEKDFQSKSIEHLCKDFIDNFSDLTSADVTLTSKDKEEVPSVRRILSARSLVFRKMFKPKAKVSEAGRVDIEDLSGRSLQVLNTYLLTGRLDPEWKDDLILEELTYAAEKYDLVHFKEFLNKVLGNVCSKENAKVLAILAAKVGMKKAERDLIEYLRKYALTAEDITVIEIQPSSEDGDEPSSKRFKLNEE